MKLLHLWEYVAEWLKTQNHEVVDEDHGFESAEMTLSRKLPDFRKVYSVPPVQKIRNMYNFKNFLNISGYFFSQFTDIKQFRGTHVVSLQGISPHSVCAWQKNW